MKAIINGTENYKSSVFYGKQFDQRFNVSRYEHNYEKDRYIIDFSDQ